MIYPTINMKMTSGYPKCANPRWLPKWPQNAINGHTSDSMADRVVKLMAKYMFSGMSYLNECIKIEWLADYGCQWLELAAHNNTWLDYTMEAYRCHFFAGPLHQQVGNLFSNRRHVVANGGYNAAT